MSYLNLMDRLKRGLRILRKADEGRKRRWLVAATAIAAVVLVTAWIGYMNSEVAPLVGRAAGQESTVELVSPPAEPAAGEPEGGVIETFTRGVERIARWVGSGVSRAIDGVRKLVEGKQYEYTF